MTDNQKQFQDKYVALKSLKKQIESAKEQYEGINGQLEQISESLINLRQISSLKEDTEILVPISNGVFIKAGVKDASKFIVNVGAGAGIEKDLKGVEEILNSQKKELSEVRETIQSDLNEMETKALRISDELKELMN